MQNIFASYQKIKQISINLSKYINLEHKAVKIRGLGPFENENNNSK